MSRPSFQQNDIIIYDNKGWFHFYTQSLDRNYEWDKVIERLPRRTLEGLSKERNFIQKKRKFESKGRNDDHIWSLSCTFLLLLFSSSSFRSKHVFFSRALLSLARNSLTAERASIRRWRATRDLEWILGARSRSENHWRNEGRGDNNRLTLRSENQSGLLPSKQAWRKGNCAGGKPGVESGKKAMLRSAKFSLSVPVGYGGGWNTILNEITTVFDRPSSSEHARDEEKNKWAKKSEVDQVSPNYSGCQTRSKVITIFVLSLSLPLFVLILCSTFIHER